MHSNHIYKELFTTHFQQYRYIISISWVLEWFYNSYGCFFSVEELFQALLGNFQLYDFLFLLCLIFPPNKGSWRREGNSEKEVSHSTDCSMRTCICDDKCSLSYSQWWGDTGDNKDDILWHWGQKCMCTRLQRKRGETAKKHSETPSEGLKGTPSKPKLNKRGNFPLLVLQLLASTFPSGCSCLLALKVTKGLQGSRHP